VVRFNVMDSARQRTPIMENSLPSFLRLGYVFIFANFLNGFLLA
jgi:hypothetical protein